MTETRNTVTIETVTLTGDLHDLRNPKQARTVSCHAVYEWPNGATAEEVQAILEDNGFTPIP